MVRRLCRRFWTHPQLSEVSRPRSVFVCVCGLGVTFGFSSPSSPSTASFPRRHPLLCRHLLPRRHLFPRRFGSPAVTNSSSAASAPPPVVGSPAVVTSPFAASAPPPVFPLLPPAPSSSPTLPLRRRRRLQSILFRLHRQRRWMLNTSSPSLSSPTHPSSDGRCPGHLFPCGLDEVFRQPSLFFFFLWDARSALSFGF